MREIDPQIGQAIGLTTHAEDDRKSKNEEQIINILNNGLKLIKIASPKLKNYKNLEKLAEDVRAEIKIILENGKEGIIPGFDELVRKSMKRLKEISAESKRKY